jgi:hypothetical protein
MPPVLFTSVSVTDRRLSVIRVELHLSGYIGTASQTNMQKIRKIGIFFENRLHWQFEVPASKPFGHAWFEILKPITLYGTWTNN